jgi:hypothetical protein
MEFSAACHTTQWNDILKQDVEFAWGRSEVTSKDRLKVNAIYYNTFAAILPLLSYPWNISYESDT